MKKVLITGATGFIGSAITCQLKKKYRVVVTTRDQVQANNKSMLYLDLSKPETITRLSEMHHFDIIVHFGAQIGWSDSDEKSMLISNVICTGLLANQAEEMGTKLIFASAAIVCGSFTEYINKNSIVNTDTLYGKSKWLAEELIKISAAKYCILRIGGVFGLNGPSHLGLNVSIMDTLNNSNPVLYGDGNSQRNYIYLWDVAAFVEYAISQDIQGTHLLAGSENLTIHSMINNICQVLSSSIKPDSQHGDKKYHQLIEHSDHFPKSRDFKTALQDIKFRAGAI